MMRTKSIANAGGIPPLVALLSRGSEAARAHAAGALENLGTNDANKLAISQAKLREASASSEYAHQATTMVFLMD